MILDMIRSAFEKLARALRAPVTGTTDPTPSQRDMARQQKLLAMHRGLLAEYLRQQQQWERMEVPDFLRAGIGTLRGRIMEAKGTLRGWNVEVSDLPDDEGPNDDIAGEVQHQRGLLKIYRRNLALALQQAQFVNNPVPTTILKARDQARKEIRRIKGILRDLSDVVEDLPEEEAEG